jgi:hypothetical protein
MFEICLKRGWAVPAKAALDLCKMVEKRMSVTQKLAINLATQPFLATGGNP